MRKRRKQIPFLEISLRQTKRSAPALLIHDLNAEDLPLVLDRSDSDHEESENPSQPSQTLQSLHRLAHKCFFSSPNRGYAMTAAIHHEELISLLQPLNRNHFTVIGFTATNVTIRKHHLGNFND